MRSSGLTRDELKRRFYTAPGRIIEANEDYDLYEFLYNRGADVDTTALFRGIKPYGLFSNEVTRRQKERERR